MRHAVILVTDLQATACLVLESAGFGVSISHQLWLHCRQRVQLLRGRGIFQNAEQGIPDLTMGLKLNKTIAQYEYIAKSAQSGG